MKLIKKLFSFFWDRSLLIFAVIGGINTVLSMTSIFLLSTYTALPRFWASAIPFAVFSVPSFYFNRKYSFKSKAPLGPSILRFAIVITVCFLLSYTFKEVLFVYLRSTVWQGMNDTVYELIHVVGLQIVFTLLNYLGQRLWAFKTPEPDKPEESPTNNTGK